LFSVLDSCLVQLLPVVSVSYMEVEYWLVSEWEGLP